MLHDDMISSNYLNTRIYFLNILMIFQMRKHVDFKPGIVTLDRGTVSEAQ